MLNSILSKLDTCHKCRFTAIFMYKDIAGPICPKCNAIDIKEYKEMTELFNSELFVDELENEIDLESDDIEELNF